MIARERQAGKRRSRGEEMSVTAGEKKEEKRGGEKSLYIVLECGKLQVL